MRVYPGTLVLCALKLQECWRRLVHECWKKLVYGCWRKLVRGYITDLHFITPSLWYSNYLVHFSFLLLHHSLSGYCFKNFQWWNTKSSISSQGSATDIYWLKKSEAVILLLEKLDEFVYRSTFICPSLSSSKRYHRVRDKETGGEFQLLYCRYYKL